MSHSYQSKANTLESQFPIDIVVLWVDGSDPEWQKEKQKYQEVQVADAVANNRFRDWGLMKYWFRAIEQFAPWVRTIHFVTWGHVPGFLNLDHPKLHIVKHEDFLLAENLPVFNSCAIEMSVFRIPDLADHFIFFCDDMFLIRPLSMESFFRNGLPVADGSECAMPPLGPMMTWYGIYCNDLGLINKHFPKRATVKKNRKKYVNRIYGMRSAVKTLMMELLYQSRFVGLSYHHSAAAFQKKSFSELWEAEPDMLRITSSHRFRHFQDISQCAAQWWQIASGEFAPGKVDSKLFHATTRMADTICNAIVHQKYDMICINDPDDGTDFETTVHKIQTAFETILPDKCTFEK